MLIINIINIIISVYIISCFIVFVIMFNTIIIEKGFTYSWC